MPRTLYVFKSGRLRQKDETFYLETDSGEHQPIPVEDVRDLFLMGELDLNMNVFRLSSKKDICLHFFGYYGNYVGSFVPKDSLISGFVTVQQVKHYLDPALRCKLARTFLLGASGNMLRVLNDLKHKGPFHEEIDRIESLRGSISAEKKGDSAETLMGVEGNIRETYYSCFKRLGGLPFEKRVMRPPDNPMNALISFGNALLYGAILTELRHTQLDPTISFLHQPLTRRYSLVLDLSEIFKPLIVDRVIFAMLGHSMLKEPDFNQELNSCVLSEAGRRKFVEQFESKLRSTVRHPKLKRQVSYRQLIRLECYKLVHYFTEGHIYRTLKPWW